MSGLQNTPFSTNKTLNVNGRLIDLSLPRVMGVLNVTPDSFFDGGRYQSETAIVEQVGKMLREGADFIDVGGYSSRPGAADISEEEETKRAVDAIGLIVRQFPGTIISIDTFRSGVARAAMEAGASMINDIGGGNLDEKMFGTAADLKVPYILMHMKGDPRTMSRQTQYTHLLKELIDHFHTKVRALEEAGVKDIIIDPGFGFSKTLSQNFSVLRNLEKLTIVGRPILAGLSRKSVIWKTLGIQPDRALNGTSVLNTIALLKGVSILRVHDVGAAKECIKLFTSLQVEVSQ